MRGTGSVKIDVNSLVWILNCDWKTPEDFVVPQNTQIVAITAHTNGSHMGGILASFSNNVVTNETWHCMENGDNEKTEIATTSNLPKPTDDFSGGAARARWIWVKNIHATHVACIKTFSKYLP